jgi:hypothetical protein
MELQQAAGSLVAFSQRFLPVEGVLSAGVGTAAGGAQCLTEADNDSAGEQIEDHADEIMGFEE